jgi:hypothetical protein
MATSPAGGGMVVHGLASSITGSSVTREVEVVVVVHKLGTQLVELEGGGDGNCWSRNQMHGTVNTGGGGGGLVRSGLELMEVLVVKEL